MFEFLNWVDSVVIDLGWSWPAIAIVLGFIVTNCVTIYVTRFKQTAESNRLLASERRALLQMSLNQFYYPIKSRIAQNRSIVDGIGRSTFPNVESDLEDRERLKLEARRNEAARTWLGVRDAVILPINKEIKELIDKKTQYLHAEDGVESYLPLVQHIVMYDHFVQNPSEAYSGFQFPVGVEEHISSMIEKILTEMREYS